MSGSQVCRSKAGTMRVFQNSGIYPSYLPVLNELAKNATTFAERRDAFLADRFGALHFLQPVLNGSLDAFFTNGDDDIQQRFWARENGLPREASREQILLAQIEHHRTEVFYNMDPVRYPSAFVRKLPGCVKKSVCWRAAPSAGEDFGAYDAVLGNFPSIAERWRRHGWRAELFFPAVDRVMARYNQADRPIDVLFVGGYSRHHVTRAKVLEQIARMAGSFNVVYHLDASRLTRSAESLLGRFVPGLAKHRRPRAVRRIARPPVFGRRLYELLGKSKIVLNGAIDMAGFDRGNMRCFEAMGCGALLVSDQGNYPEGMSKGVSMLTYGSAKDADRQIRTALDEWSLSQEIAKRGCETVTSQYAKQRQWQDFVELIAQV
jgi:hypothetical protein